MYLLAYQFTMGLCLFHRQELWTLSMSTVWGWKYAMIRRGLVFTFRSSISPVSFFLYPCPGNVCVCVCVMKVLTYHSQLLPVWQTLPLAPPGLSAQPLSLSPPAIPEAAALCSH